MPSPFLLLVDVQAGDVFEGLDEGVVAEAPFAVLLELVVELMDEAGGEEGTPSSRADSRTRRRSFC